MDRILEIIADQTRARPEAPAVTEAGETLTYAELAAATDRLALALVECGQPPGTVIGWLGGVGRGQVVCLIAAQKAGLGLAAPDPRLPTEQARAWLEVAGASLLVVEREGLDTPFEGAFGPTLPAPPIHGGPAPVFTLVPAPADAISNVRYTSGSTGRPKAVPVSRAIEAYFDATVSDRTPVTLEDRLSWLGHFWPGTIFSTLMAGAEISCFDAAAASAQEFADWMAHERITMTRTYPAIFRQLFVVGRKLPDLRAALLAGEPLTRADVEAFERITEPGAALFNSFGSNEFPATTTYRHEWGAPLLHDTLPLGLPDVEGTVRLIDEAGGEVAPGEVGEMEIVSPFLPAAYLGGERGASDVFRQLDDGRRAFRTGDLAYADLDGGLHPMGRRDEQVKIRGYNVRPTEIEPLLMARGDVDEAAIIAVDGPRGVRRLVCDYVGPASAGELKAFLSARLPNYMIPTLWRRREALPKTGTGKVRRADLRALPRAPAAPIAIDAADPVEAGLGAIFSALLEEVSFGREDDFFDLGGDSLQAMTLVLEIERRFGRRLPYELLMLEGASIADLAARLARVRSGRVVTLRSGGAGAPLVLAHVRGGHYSDYLAVLHDLGPDTPALGIYPRGLDGDKPHADMAGIAGDAVDALIAERGDAVLAAFMGYSFGGAIAFEMARAWLARTGDRARLILIDPRAGWLASRHWLRRALRAGRRGDAGLALDVASKNLKAAVGLDPGGVDEAHEAAWLRYRPKPAAVSRALMVWAEGRADSEDAAAWAGMVQGPQRNVTTRGDHLAMMRAPNAAPLALRIRGWLAEAD